MLHIWAFFFPSQELLYQHSPDCHALVCHSDHSSVGPLRVGWVELVQAGWLAGEQYDEICNLERHLWVFAPVPKETDPERETLGSVLGTGIRGEANEIGLGRRKS